MKENCKTVKDILYFFKDILEHLKELCFPYETLSNYVFVILLTLITSFYIICFEPTFFYAPLLYLQINFVYYITHNIGCKFKLKCFNTYDIVFDIVIIMYIILNLIFNAKF